MGESVFELILAFVGRDLVTGIIGGVGHSLGGLVKHIEESDNGFVRFGGRASMITAGIGVAMIGAAAGIASGMVAMARGAEDFQKYMVLVSTHAGYTRKQIEDLIPAVLHLAGETGKSPEELAQGLFMVASGGIKAGDAMRILAAAAKEAAMGHASVETTALSLTRILNVGIQAISGTGKALTDETQAMNMINQTIGESQLRLEQYNAFLGTGVLQAAKLFGVGMNEMGASLAVMTRAGMNAEESGTRMRMAFALIAAPSGVAMQHLKELGLTSNESADMMTRFNTVITKAHLTTSMLATEMRTHGLVPALEMLKEHLAGTGMSVDQVNQFIAVSFGRARSMTGLLALIQGLDTLKKLSKENANPENDFAAKWANASNSLEIQQNRLTESLHATKIALGLAFIPAVQAVMEHVTPVVQTIGMWISEHGQLIGKLIPTAAVILGIGGALLTLVGVIGMVTFAAGPMLVPIIAIALVAGLLLTHLKELSDFFKAILVPVLELLTPLWDKVKTAFNTFQMLVKSGFSPLVALQVALMNLGVPLKFLNVIFPIIRSAVERVVETWHTLSDIFERSLVGVRAFFQDLLHGESVFTSISSAIANFAGKSSEDMAVFKTMQTVFKNIGDVIGVVARFLIGNFKPVWDEIVNAIRGGIREAIAQAGPIIKHLGDAFRDIVEALQPFIAVMKTAILPLLGVVLVVAIAIAMGLLRGLASVFGALLPAAIKILGGAFHIVIDVIQIVAALFGWFFSVIQDIFQGKWGKIWTDTIKLFSKILPAILDILRNLVGMILNLLGGLGSAVWGFLSGFVQGFINFFVQLWKALVGGSIIPDMINAIIACVTGLPGAIFGILASLVGGAISRVLAWSGKMIGHVKDMVTGVIGGFIDMEKRGIERIASFIGSILKHIADFAGSVLGAAGDIGKNIVTGITNGLRGAWDGLVSTFKSLAKNLPGPIKSLFGITSPSTLFANEIGKPISQGMAMGITSAAKSVAAAGVDTVQDALAASSKAASTPIKGFSGALGAITGTFGGPAAAPGAAGGRGAFGGIPVYPLIQVNRMEVKQLVPPGGQPDPFRNSNLNAGGGNNNQVTRHEITLNLDGKLLKKFVIDNIAEAFGN